VFNTRTIPLSELSEHHVLPCYVEFRTGGSYGQILEIFVDRAAVEILLASKLHFYYVS
jgi:hypothetical protein